MVWKGWSAGSFDVGEQNHFLSFITFGVANKEAKNQIIKNKKSDRKESDILRPCLLSEYKAINRWTVCCLYSDGRDT